MRETKTSVPRSHEPERTTAIIRDFLPAERDMPVETPEGDPVKAPVDRRQRDPRQKG